MEYQNVKNCKLIRFYRFLSNTNDAEFSRVSALLIIIKLLSAKFLAGLL